MPRTISKERAYQITTYWGSYMNSWDPGACMYGFHVGDGRPQSEQHRQQCLAYIQGLIDSEESEVPVGGGSTKPKYWIKELKSLRNWFKHCPLITEAGKGQIKYG